MSNRRGTSFWCILTASGNEISDALMRKGVIVRPVAGYGFPNSIRVTIGTPEENERFVKGLKAVLADK